MGQGIKDLEPGSLYITVAVPKPKSCHFNPAEALLNYPPAFPANFDLTTYETWCADTYELEEFDWGLYWHRGRGDGTWYGLSPVDHSIDIHLTRLGLSTSIGMSGVVFPPLYKYTLIRRDMCQSPRLQGHVAGLIRVLHVPGSVASELTTYLDWLAAHAAATATRSFIWATSLYLRTRRHITANPRDGANQGMPAGFDITGFLCEALHFAYGEVCHGLAGQLPRPIMVSAYGVDLAWKGAAATHKGENKKMQHQYQHQPRGC
ncbi:hypothetical protein PT974_02005 [Cladobotryum mycophilum]|uniref:Uncharacterized protein n=1 Tax=Cladobotryum mycophilum TaxID=491253 RepID=A0ABR0SY55_9HYPO